jgi:hypothetical protein
MPEYYHWLEINMWVLGNKSTYVSLPHWRVVKELVFKYCEVCWLFVAWELEFVVAYVCYFGEYMSCGLINIYCAIWIEKTTNKSCQNFLFFCKEQQKSVSFAINRRFRVGFRRFFTDKLVQIQIDLNWSNRSTFTSLPLVNRYRWGRFLPPERFCKLWLPSTLISRNHIQPLDDIMARVCQPGHPSNTGHHRLIGESRHKLLKFEYKTNLKYARF